MATPPRDSRQQTAEYDFIIVGSGAGGGPLACNLAKQGYRVLVLEAGGWDSPEVCEVPAFHPHSSEDPELSWQFFVKHYANPLEVDSKWDTANDGIFYPRAATVGGCTVHNAMITICGPNDDWDKIAELTSDKTWNSERMRGYFERLEHCDYAERPDQKKTSLWGRIKALFGSSNNPGRHGFDGWLHTSMADPRLGLKDHELVGEILSALVTVMGVGLDTLESLFDCIFKGGIKARFDPNNWETMQNYPEGLLSVPIAVRNGQRNGPRDYLRETQQSHPDKLTIQTETLVTEILFDREPGAAGEPAAIGVRFLRGKHLYKAHPEPSEVAGATGDVYCKREVILCGGTYNTPQLLKLSGIGPRAELEKFQIPVRVDLPGVGENLQDRYEVGIISEVNKDFALLKGLDLGEPGPHRPADPALDEWRSKKTGLYAGNAVIIGMLKKSKPELPAPDLFIFAVPGYFKGYFVGYADAKAGQHNLLTWLILKAHSKNRAGTVLLRSKNPLDVPEINFHYFYEGSDRDKGEDLAAVVEAVKLVRNINQHARRKGVVKDEIWPGPQVADDDAIRGFISREAWGHHASGTCRIGAGDDPQAVLNSRFRVRGVQNLRVVDASVFPRIPGVFIVTNVYMISEKASDVIAEDNPL
ncbi:MAG: choline dehydrogenase [Verrucomicrobiota bacterium]